MIAQSWMDTISSLLEACNTCLLHRAITYLQIQGAVILTLLAVGWLLSGIMRLRELRRTQVGGRLSAPAKVDSSGGGGSLKGSGSAAQLAAAAGDSDQREWPPVSVILPVKGQRPHSLDAWRSQLSLEYDGALEFLFLVDDAGDAACAPLHGLMGQRKGVNARLLVAPHATATSQKIRNILAGVAAADGESQFILCLDDDVVLHPGALVTLVAGLRNDSSLFMATGYPFDVPPEGASLLTYCILAYHLPLLIAFSIRQHTSFVWGGCMLFPADALRLDTHGILKAWSEGGYSDDLIVAAKCGEAGLRILCPSSAIFRQSLVADPALSAWWNYLRRQLFVMDTYAGGHNRRLNHGMLALHAYLSWAIVAPLCTVTARLAVWAAQTALLPTQRIYGGPGTSWDWLSCFSGGSHLTGVILALLAALHPDESAHPQPTVFCWTKLWAGFMASNALLPLCAAFTFLAPHVEWSGSRYWKRRGRVVRVQRRA